MLSRKQLTERIPVAPLTLSRLIRANCDFPKPEKYGKSLYFDWQAVQRWLETRASKSVILNQDDILWTSEQVSQALGRSLPWINQKIIKPESFTRFNLAPSQNPKSNKNYFLAREIEQAFPELIHLAAQSHKCQ